MTELTEPRLIKEQALEHEIALFCEPLLNSIGYRLVRVALLENGTNLQIMLEKPDGSCTIDDCEAANQLLSGSIEAQDFFTHSYNLEISSPGMDRPLVRKSDFIRHQNHLAKVELHEPILEKRRYKGTIHNINEDNFILIEPNEQQEITINFSNIKTAKLILTDDLIKQCLKEDKKRQKQAKFERKEKKNG